MGSFEEELYSSMKEKLSTNSRKEDSKTQASNLKTIQFLNSVSELLEKNGFTKQAEAVTSYMGKRIGLKQVFASFQDKTFINALDKDTSDNLKYCLSQAGLDANKFIDKKYFNEYDKLLDVKYSRALKPTLSFEEAPILYNGEVVKPNKYLQAMKNVISNSSNEEISGLDDDHELKVTSEDFEDE